MIKILIVDDESGIRSLLSEILSEEGFLVYEAPDAAHARQMLAKETFNLILLDIWMPDTDGITLLKEWVGRNLLRTTSVVVMSGHGTIETAMEAVKLGAKDFLEKPISMKRLLETVHGVIQEWIATHAQPAPHKPTPAAGPAVKPLRSPAGEASVRPVAAAPAQPRHPAVRDFTINGKKVPARSDKKLRQLFNNFRRSLNEDLTRSRSPEDLYGEITERRKETRGGPNYILKMLAGLLRDIVCTHPEYESADWMLSSANRALKRRYFSRFLSIMRDRMKSRQIGLPHGRYHDQAIRTKADGAPSGLPSEPELALQRSLEFLSNINRPDSPLPGVKDITVLPEPVYNAESERDYAEVRDVKDDDRKDDELFDTKDQFCVDFFGAILSHAARLPGTQPQESAQTAARRRRHDGAPEDAARLRARLQPPARLQHDRAEGARSGGAELFPHAPPAGEPARGRGGAHRRRGAHAPLPQAQAARHHPEGTQSGGQRTNPRTPGRARQSGKGKARTGTGRRAKQ